VHTDRDERSRRPPSPDELWAGIVAEVATMPDVVANLLRDHQPNAKGYCTGNGCGSPGRGVPATRWPCSLHALAAEANGAGASQRAPASKERTTPGSRPSDTEANGAGASQQAPASKERTASGGRPFDAEPQATRAVEWIVARRRPADTAADDGVRRR
jgi:hypothetical protein